MKKAFTLAVLLCLYTPAVAAELYAKLEPLAPLVEAIARQESGLNPLAVNIAGKSLYPATREEAKQLWPLIEWCLEYNRRQLNADGVVSSDSDELEGRFPAGKANLCTSSLYYDALLSACYLGRETGINRTQLAQYKKQAEELRKNIDRYFGGEVEGFNTYRYYKENDKLRSWICIPLTVGIFDRKDETIKALFSPRLWTQDGLLTESGSQTFWDRSTLYALRGVYACGETDKATEYKVLFRPASVG